MIGNKKSPSQLVEEIISEARARTRGYGALTAEAAALEVARKFEKFGIIKSSEFGAYVKKATETLLSRLKKENEARKERRLIGAEEAALARRDAEIAEAEEAEERLSEIRRQAGRER